jgi:site-specific DNA-cytosine methylase
LISQGFSPTRLGAKTGLYQIGVIKNRGKLKSRDEATCLDANYYKGLDNHGARTGVKVKQSLTSIKSQIRRLTPRECERLQGFPDDWTEGISDTQRYKCLGNAVTTNVVTEIINRLYSNN